MTRFSSYDLVAAEYYIGRLHPTCAYLGATSENSIKKFLMNKPSGRLIEIGCGKGITYDARFAAYYTDLSATMAQERVSSGRFVLADVNALPFSSSSFNYVVSSLGDPYLTGRMLSEVSRLLVAGGTLLLTVPAWDWSSQFRASDKINAAEFELMDGTKALVPSFIKPPPEQAQEISSAGFVNVQYSAVLGGGGEGELPPKMAQQNGRPVIDLYSAEV